jgi:hypothetical protein
MITILTKSGGSVDFDINNSGIYGTRLYLHIDQSANIRNGEGEAAIIIDTQECKEMIAALNDFIKFIEGKDFVYTSDSVIDLIKKPELQKALKDLGYHQHDHKHEGHQGQI